MEAALQMILGPAFLLIGLSHAAQPAAWVRFFEVVKGTGVAGFIIAMFSLPIGLVLLAGHQVWRWEPALLLTVAGYGLTFKSTLYLLAPRFADYMIERKMAKSLWSYQVAGAVMAVLAGFITWQAWAARLAA